MQKLHETIFIQAPEEKVWDIMLAEETYKEWTKPFNPVSSHEGRVEGNWEKGSKMLFIGVGDDGSEMGMVSYIAENKPYEFLSIKHNGIYKDGVEDTESEEAKSWAPAYENYTFTPKDGGTELSIDMDVNEEYLPMFKEMWPKALQMLKELSEK